MYKLTQLDGTDFYTGTVNYADAVGTIVRVTDYDPKAVGVCGKGLHASRNPNDCFIGAEIPCRAFRVKGIGRIAGDKQKSRYKALRVIEEIHDLDALFGWKYSEAANPIHPFKIPPPEITDAHIKLLRRWASMGASMGASVWDSMRDSVRASVSDSVRATVWDSVWASMGAFVWDFVWAYISSFFPNIKQWKYIDHPPGENPFQPGIDLWKMGLVPSFDRKIWRLHGGAKGEILYETPTL